MSVIKKLCNESWFQLLIATGCVLVCFAFLLGIDEGLNQGFLYGR